jgi:bacterioferritin
MRRDESIKLLNKAVGDELQAIHQYMYFHFHLGDLGLAPLSELLRRTAIEEMMHLERLAERILFLKGDVVMTATAPVEPIVEPEAILAKAMQMEEEGVADYNRAALECGQHADSQSKQLFESLVADEERHLDGFEKQVDNIRRFGLSYLALQSFAQNPEPQGGGKPGA